MLLGSLYATVSYLLDSLLLWRVATKCMFSVGRKRKGYSNPPSVRSVGPEIYTTCPSEVSQIMVKQEGELNSP